MLIDIQAGDFCKWSSDTQCFLLEHFDAIHDSPSQVYHSALPLCPSSLWLYECYGTELSKEVRVVKGLQAEWGKCSRTVVLSSTPRAISYWGTTIAVGLDYGEIIILDAITGSCMAMLSGHNKAVLAVTFSTDGKLLASGGQDHTVKLWDIQTGGIIKNFSGHKNFVESVSISADSAIIASGSGDETICFWDISTGNCHCVIEQQYEVYQVIFSPTDPKQLIGELLCERVSHWDINGCQIGPTYDGGHIALSLDGKQMVLQNKKAIIVQTFGPRATVAEFHVTNGTPRYCCFSPNGKLIAAAVDKTAHVWDISSSGSHPIETFIGHTSNITALAFYSLSSLISVSDDLSVKFWQIGTLSTDPVETNLDPTSFSSHEIISTTLQAKDGITITSDSDGTVQVWDISTGLCKVSFQTPASGSKYRDGQFINGRLIFAWNVGTKIHISGVSEEELILAPSESGSAIQGLRIGDDGSTIFCLGETYIQAWSIMTGEVLGKVKVEFSVHKRNLVVDGLRVWACNSKSKDQRWDFGVPGSPPIQLPNISPSKLHPNGALLWNLAESKVQDVVTGGVVFQLPKSLGKPIDVQWNDQNLVICFGSTEVLILDFTHVLAL